MRDKIIIIIHFRLCPEFCLFNTPVILPTNQNKIYTQGMNLIKSELTKQKHTIQWNNQGTEEHTHFAVIFSIKASKIF